MTNETVCTNDYCLSDDDYLDFIKDHVMPTSWEWVFAVVFFLTFILGITGNILVCFAVWRNRAMRTVTNIFIVNLAVGDLVVIIICLPPTFIHDVTETWFFGHVMCKVTLYLQTVSVSVSVLTLSAISVERWYAICYPLRFKSTRKRAQIIILIIWIVSCLVALPDIIVAGTKPFRPELTNLLTSCGPVWSKSNTVIYHGTLIVVLYIFPVALMAFTYTRIVIVLWTGAIPGAVETTQAPMMNSKITKADEQLESRRKAAKMLITVVMMFALCYFPVYLMNVLRYTGVLRADPLNPDPAVVMTLVSHLLPYINSSINPIIYNFMSAKFRKEFMIACPCCSRRPPYKGRILGRNGTHFGSTSNYLPRQSSNTYTEQILMSTYQE